MLETIFVFNRINANADFLVRPVIGNS